MSPEENSAGEKPLETTREKLTALLHEANEAALLATLENSELEEAHVCLLLERLDISVAVLEAVVKQTKWLQSEAVRFRLARHPRTPRRAALRLVRQLFPFHLAEVSLAPSAPAEVRRLAEEILSARVPQLPLGQKLSLARRASSRVAGALLLEGHVRVIRRVLDNPRLTESQVLRTLAHASTPERVVAAIAQHPKWVMQYHVRLTLVRHPHTPFPAALSILRSLTLRDLEDLIQSAVAPPFVHRHAVKELARRSGATQSGKSE